MPVLRVTVVEAPEPIVSLDAAKRHLRVDDNEQDQYVADLIETATAWLDAPAGWLGRSLGEQVLEARFPTGPAAAARDYPYPPMQVVVGETPDPDGTTTVVRWRAGYPEGKVPAPIRHAILLMVGHLYTNRDAVSSGTAQPAAMPLGVEALLAPYRVMTI